MNRVTIVRTRRSPGGRDRYGDPKPSTTSTASIDGCLVAPRYDGAGDVDEDPGRRGRLVGITIYAPPGADLVNGDEVTYDGDPYRVIDTPGAWDGSRVGGLEVRLERAAG